MTSKSTAKSKEQNPHKNRDIPGFFFFFFWGGLLSKGHLFFVIVVAWTIAQNLDNFMWIPGIKLHVIFFLFFFF